MPIENGGVGGGEGTPDVEAARDGRTAWIETKFWRDLPRRVLLGTHPLKLTPRQLRPAQRVWHTLRYRAGGYSFFHIVAELPAGHEWYVLDGFPAATHLGVDWHLPEIRRLNLLPFNSRRPTTKELLQCLLLSP